MRQEKEDRRTAAEVYAEWRRLGFTFRNQSTGWWHERFQDQSMLYVGGVARPALNLPKDSSRTRSTRPELTPAVSRRELTPRCSKAAFHSFQIAILVETPPRTPDVEIHRSDCQLNIFRKNFNLEKALDQFAAETLKESTDLNYRIMKNMLRRDDIGSSIIERLDLRAVAITLEQLWQCVDDFLDKNRKRWPQDQFDSLRDMLKTEVFHRGTLSGYRFRDGKWRDTDETKPCDPRELVFRTLTREAQERNLRRGFTRNIPPPPFWDYTKVLV